MRGLDAQLKVRQPPLKVGCRYRESNRGPARSRCTVPLRLNPSPDSRDGGEVRARSQGKECSQNLLWWRAVRGEEEAMSTITNGRPSHYKSKSHSISCGGHRSVLHSVAPLPFDQPRHPSFFPPLSSHLFFCSPSLCFL